MVRVFITDFIKSSKFNRQEICDKTESINEGREDFFFLTEVRDARIRGAALVLDEKNFTGAWKIICVKSVFPLTFPR